MTVAFARTGPPVTPEMVDEFEARLPGPFPADYRTFLLRQNGGAPEPNWWPPERGRGVGVHWFLSLGDVVYWASLVQHREVFEGRIPDHLLSIGYDEGSAQVCVALAGDDVGSVWVYDADYEFDEDEPPVPELLTRMCDSFTALLEGLEPAPELGEMNERYAAAAPTETDGSR